MSRKSESTMNTRKVIQESRELNNELAGLIADRERLMSKLMDLDKVLEKEEEMRATVSTTSKAVESLNSPATCVSTTEQAVESSNSPAMPVVVVTKAPAVEDEANYNYEEIVAGTSFRSVRSYFDTESNASEPHAEESNARIPE